MGNVVSKQRFRAGFPFWELAEIRIAAGNNVGRTSRLYELYLRHSVLSTRMFVLADKQVPAEAVDSRFF